MRRVQGGDYKQYMHYSKYAQGHGSQGSDYKQYMQSYGGDYNKYMQGHGSQAGWYQIRFEGGGTTVSIIFCTDSC